jgi:hypothetical protein
MKACRCVVFTEGSGPAALVGGGLTAVATRRGREASATRAAGRPRPHDLERAAVRRDSKAAVRRAWQGQCLSGAP